MTIEALQNEIRAFALERVRDIAKYDQDKLEDVHDLHNEIFNTDYYIIGRHAAIQWLGSLVFQAIELIKEYEDDNFGESYTDFSDPEKVVNMLAYVLGERVIYGVVDEVKEEYELA